MKKLLSLLTILIPLLAHSQTEPTLEQLLKVGQKYTLTIGTDNQVTGTVLTVDSSSVTLSMGERELRMPFVRITRVLDVGRSIYIYPPEIYGDSIGQVPSLKPVVRIERSSVPNALVPQGRFSVYGDLGLSALYIGYFITLTGEGRVFISEDKNHLVDVHGGFGECGALNHSTYKVAYGGLGYCYRFAKIRTGSDIIGFMVEGQAEWGYLYDGSFTNARDVNFPLFEWGIRTEFQNWGPMFHASLNSTLGVTVGIGAHF